MKSKYQDLLESAQNVRLNAYAPYSGFKVGAALLGADGRVFAGCNVENISYGLSLCAERVVVCSAISFGVRQFAAMAIVGSERSFAIPCGACLQTLAEFCDDDFVVMLGMPNASEVETRVLKELLPQRFSLFPPM